MPVRIQTVAVGWTAVLLAEFGMISLPAPQARRQIPRSVFLKGPNRAALQFGAELGSGIRTFISSYLPYGAAITLILVADSYLEPLLLGAGFGAGRAAPVWFRQGAQSGSSWDQVLVLVLKRGPLLASLAPIAAVLFTL